MLLKNGSVTTDEDPSWFTTLLSRPDKQKQVLIDGPYRDPLSFRPCPIVHVHVVGRMQIIMARRAAWHAASTCGGHFLGEDCGLDGVSRISRSKDSSRYAVGVWISKHKVG